MNAKILFTELNCSNSELDIKALRKFVKNNGFLVLFINTDSGMAIKREISEGFDNELLNHIYIFKENQNGCTVDKYGMADCLSFGVSSLFKSDSQKAEERATITSKMIERVRKQGYSDLDIYAFGSNLMRDLPTMITVANNGGEFGIKTVTRSIEEPLEKYLESISEFSSLNLVLSHANEAKSKYDMSTFRATLIDSKNRLEQLREETDDFYDMLFDNYPLIEEKQYSSLSTFMKSVIFNSKRLRKAS